MKRVVRFRALFPFLACALPAACSQQDATSGAGDLTTTFDTAGGVVHVTNTGTPPEWRLAPVVSIGPKTLTDEGAPEEFGGVTAVALGPGGQRVRPRTPGTARYASSVWMARTFAPSGGTAKGPASSGASTPSPGSETGCSPTIPTWAASASFSAQGEWLGQRRTVGGLTGSPAQISASTLSVQTRSFGMRYGAEAWSPMGRPRQRRRHRRHDSLGPERRARGSPWRRRCRSSAGGREGMIIGFYGHPFAAPGSSSTRPPVESCTRRGDTTTGLWSRRAMGDTLQCDRANTA